MRWFQHLSEAEDQGVFLCSQSDSVTVAHGEVDLATVTPQGRGVGWHPSGEQPGTDKNTSIISELIQRKNVCTANNISLFVAQWQRQLLMTISDIPF